MRKILFGAFLLFILGHAHAELPQTLEGKDIMVTLCEVSEITKKVLSDEFDNAEYGIEFVVVIIKKVAKSSQFTMKELRDFQVNGTSFVQSSTHKVEPKTTVDAVEKHRMQLVKWDIPQFIGMRGLVMKTRIAGDRVAPFEIISVDLELGWGGDQETYSFAVGRDSITSSK